MPRWATSTSTRLFRPVCRTETLRRQLDIATAMARTSFAAGPVSYTRDYFVSNPDRVLVIRLTASTPGALAFTVRADSQLHRTVTVDGRGDLVLAGRAPKHAEPNYRSDIKEPSDLRRRPGRQGDEIRGARSRPEDRWPRRARRVDAFGARRARGAGGRGGRDQLHVVRPGAEPRARSRSGRPPRAWTALARRTFDEPARCARRATTGACSAVCRSTSASGPQDALPTDRRLRDYAAGAVDPGLEALYYQYGRYLLISASRAGGPPANLQGIWNPHLRPPWSSNYTVNINTEMNYWPAETTNLAECHQPLLRFIGDLARTGAVTARHFYGCSRLVRAPQQRHLGHQQPGRRPRSGQPDVGELADVRACGSACTCGSTTRSAATRRGCESTGYPLMKGAAEFALDWLVRGPGRVPRHRAVHVAREPVQDARRVRRVRLGDDDGGPGAGARRPAERRAGVGGAGRRRGVPRQGEGDAREAPAIQDREAAATCRSGTSTGTTRIRSTGTCRT